MTREEIREAVSSPYDGTSDKYGRWGALNVEQRRTILRLLDELDNDDKVIKELYYRNQNARDYIIKNNFYRVISYQEKDNAIVELDKYEILNILDGKSE